MSFDRILKASVLMGFAQVAQLIAAFIRAKLVALLLGPSGVGLVGLLTSFNGNVSALAGWGLGTSGVRSIASAPPQERAGRITAVRRLGWMLSWAGLALVLVLAFPAGAGIALGGDSAVIETLIAGIAVPCLVASGAWGAILQAGGQLKALAWAQVIGALVALLVGAPLILQFGHVGVAVALALAAGVPAMMLWCAARRHAPPAPDSGLSDLRPLLVMGGALMLVGFFAQVSAYLVRLQLVDFGGLEAAGYYHAAFAVAGSLPGFVFVAMGADFFPRVAGAASEAEAAVHADHQVSAGLVLGVPLLALLLAGGGPVLSLLYAKDFEPALPLLSWMVWGVFLRLISWPLGYWLLARGSSRAVIFVEGLSSALMTALPFWLLPRMGLVGAAVSFALGYVAYTVILLVMARRRSGSWLSLRTAVGAGLSSLALAATQWASASSPPLAICIVATIATACWNIGRRALNQPHAPKN
ncbi:MAG: polysaccharide biosynthesis C-terminal domain-containing protein [Opitutia bacterium]